MIPANDLASIVQRLRERMARRRSHGYRDVGVHMLELERLIEVASQVESPRARLIRLAMGGGDGGEP